MPDTPKLTRAELFADKALPIELIRRSPQEPYPLHSHEFSELVIIFGGRGTHFTERDEYPIEAGDVFVIQGERAHGYSDLEQLMLVNILFDPAALRVPESDLISIPGYHALLTIEPSYRRLHRFESRLRLAAAQLAEVELLVDALEREIRDKEPGYHSMVTAYFMQVVGFLSRCFVDSERPERRALLALGRAISHLERNLTRMVRVDELVELSGLSKSSLLRAFRRSVGLSPIGYHIHLKIRFAATLLRSSELSITEVAYRSGFADSNYFSRQFGKVMGMSPRAYRRQGRTETP